MDNLKVGIIFKTGHLNPLSNIMIICVFPQDRGNSLEREQYPDPYVGRWDAGAVVDDNVEDSSGTPSNSTVVKSKGF